MFFNYISLLTIPRHTSYRYGEPFHISYFIFKIMFTTLAIIIVIIAALLMIAVLIQNPKGGGLSDTFGGGSTQMFGVKKTTDVLEQLTWGLAIAITVLSLTGHLLVDKNNGTDIQSVNAERAATKNIPTPAAAPATAPPAGTPATTPPPANK
jgi:preprotein translocase subunit SecG